MENETLRPGHADDEAVFDAPVEALVPAPINVHTVESDDDPEFAGLVASVKANGIIHRILVRRVDFGKWQIIDGHRRFYAAKAAGLKTIPVETLNADAAKAAVLTVATNVQRRSNDPLLEADLIDWLRKQNLTAGEIAAELGKGETYVVTRAKLVDLSPEWRSLAKRCKCTTDLLVKVARFSRELQDEIAEAAGIADPGYGSDGETIGWDDFKYMFDRRMCKLDAAVFDTAPCAKCPHNTSTQRFLFPPDDDPDAMCERAACYVERNNAAVDALITRLRSAGTPAIEVMGPYYVPESWNAKSSRDEDHPQAYVFKDGEVKRVMWSVPKAEKAKDAATEEERKRLREERKEAKRVAFAKDRIRETVAESLEKAREADRLVAAVHRITRSDAFSKWGTRTILSRIAGELTPDGAIELLSMCGGRRNFEREFIMDFCAEDRDLIDAIAKEAEEEGGAE